MYYVLFVKDCTPITKKFKNKKKVKKFLNRFIDKYGSLDDQEGNWIDQIFKGKKLNIKEMV